MDLDKLTDFFDDDNVDQLKGLWEDKDRIAGAVDWVMDHRDEVLALVQALPKLLVEVGETMGAAGAGATDAAGLLTGESGTSVKELAASAAEALERCTKELAAVTEALSTVGDKLDAIPLVDGIADSMGDGSDRLEAIAEDLGEVAKQLRGVGDQVTDAGQNLAVVGAKLTDGGTALARFRLEPT